MSHAASPSSPLASSEESSLAARIDAVIGGALAAQRIVGTVVLVSRDGETIYRRAAGWADREAHVPMRVETLFRLASMTKLFVSTATMVLVARNQLDLEDEVSRWLPDFKPRLANGQPATIRVRHLLTHTAGLTYSFLEPEDGPYHRAGVSDGMDRVPHGLEENLRRIASVPLLFEPGTAWNYSLATDVLGAVVAAASGLSLPAAIGTLVAEPLGLIDSAFHVTDPARLAAAYADDAPRPRRMGEPETIKWLEGMAAIVMDPSRAFDPSAFPSGGAGMVGTAEDVLRLLETLRRGGAPLLPSTLVSEMGRNQIGTLPVPDWPGWGFGLGFSVLTDPSVAGTLEAPGTWRWGGAYGHSWFVDPVRKLSVVALTNTALEGMSGGRFPQDLCRAVYNN
ncbi:CubicO group peptidase, beta-lactamase class C family [Enhydrobacter aerosaccus]|uniref:CubicO group peptidase, beta-lactamase class C family n=1 Tax=Enhydrobacter aerosaccus TaxID=225324 RepID=A0A1T4PFY2_9HYPH|nr:serine hydrolase domain-containing protein [Enhydrobacter aerosaccus]SJZ90227.1 CubicO group peptidase, beta-lactamase class C family [Enhydrobacter aerosaccus]